jgi:hypothetical protein
MASISLLVVIVSLVALLVVGTEDMGSGHTVFASEHVALMLPIEALMFKRTLIKTKGAKALEQRLESQMHVLLHPGALSYPRKVQTKTDPRQVKVNNDEEIMKRLAAAGYTDCRRYTIYMKIQRMEMLAAPVLLLLLAMGTLITIDTKAGWDDGFKDKVGRSK